MPDMPQGGAPAPAGPPAQSPPQGDPQGAPPGGGGGGIGDAIIQVDSTLNKITQAVTQNAKLGDDVKSAFQQALSAFRGAAQALVKAADGDGPDQEPDGDESGGAVTPQQGGASGAVPVSHQNMRGG